MCCGSAQWCCSVNRYSVCSNPASPLCPTRNIPPNKGIWQLPTQILEEACALIGVYIQGLLDVNLWAHTSAIYPCNFNHSLMAPHSSTLAWKIPWTEEPGGPQSMGSLRVRHDWATSLSLFTFMHWRRKWQPTPVFLPGESQGWGSLVGCRLRGRTESDATEVT